ncbi:uncharacterized protein SOCE26_070470 [Sorangium cellulosum]|uniref:Uncharacterized protein n=1 Tax=Sorangium cellulosum TaxID=56 RepID=A0A2L0F1Z1_SORCE|nr:hypothetical protein [Sorangium cellulosum]AUX45553.1 uncharacterized protein SOCE26_070470 [Sorangium cellulosum]
MHRSALLAPAVSAALLVTLAPPALAQQPQPAPGQQPQPAPGPQPAPARADETAEQIRDRARGARALGDIDGACALLLKAHAAAVASAQAGAPGPPPAELLFELAACHEQQGRTDVAASEYDAVAAAGGPQADEARSRSAALRPPPALPLANAPAALAPSPAAAPASPAATSVLPPATAAAQLPDAPPARSTEELPVRVGDAMDTRLTWTLGDDDLLHDTGQAQPISPNVSVGDRKQYRLFFDNLNSRFSGRENLTHLALYKKMPGFIERLDTEASLVLRIDIAALSRNTNNVNQALYDAGSFIRAFYHTGASPDGKTGVGVTLWPLDTDRFRLGYLYDISWGGTNASINQSIFPRIIGTAPGAKIQYDAERFSVFGGFKVASLTQIQQVLTPGTSEVEETSVAQTNYGFLAGAGADVHPYVHVDLGAGYFQQGSFEWPDVAGQPVYTFGASARVVAHTKNEPIPQSVDFLLYRNDPNRPQIVFKPESYTPGKTTWAVSLEASNIYQNLKDFESAGATTHQAARAGALQAVIKSGYVRASLTGIYRDLAFVLRNQPSYIPFQTIPDTRGASTADELFFAAAADYYVPSARLTPGLGAGLQFPSTFRTTSFDALGTPIARTIVIREQGNLSILPYNRPAVPIFQARASVRWDISRILSAVAWIQYVRDNNGTFMERDPSEGTVALRTFVNPDFVGGGASFQARY